VSEKGYLRVVLGLGARGAHARKRRPLDERVAARARLYRRSLAVTGIVWCGALVLDHAPSPAAGLAATTPNSVLVAATAAEGGPTGAHAAVSSSDGSSLDGSHRDVGGTVVAAPGIRLIGRLAGEAREAAGVAPVSQQPVDLEVAAANCPGLSWRVLAAIAQVETGGGHMAISAAGAVGPMQLLPTTWARYRLDETARIDDFQDSAIAAARMLCADGAPEDLRRALWDYNHSEFYVDRVLSLASSIGPPTWSAA
jgi:hypothetical protein